MAGVCATQGFAYRNDVDVSDILDLRRGENAQIAKEIWQMPIVAFCGIIGA